MFEYLSCFVSRVCIAAKAVNQKSTLKVSIEFLSGKKYYKS